MQKSVSDSKQSQTDSKILQSSNQLNSTTFLEQLHVQQSQQIQKNISKSNVHNKIDMMKLNIKSLKKDDQLQEENTSLREKLLKIQQQLQSTKVKSQLWDNCKVLIENQIKIQSDSSNESLFKEFQIALKQKFNKFSLKKNQEDSLQPKIKEFMKDYSEERECCKGLKIQLQNYKKENDSLLQQCLQLRTLIDGTSNGYGPRIQNTTQLKQQLSVLFSKYKQSKMKSQVSESQNQKIRGEIQQFQQICNSIQYNYQEKIQNLRTEYDDELQKIIRNCNDMVKHSAVSNQGLNELEQTDFKINFLEGNDRALKQKQNQIKLQTPKLKNLVQSQAEEIKKLRQTIKKYKPLKKDDTNLIDSNLQTIVTSFVEQDYQETSPESITNITVESCKDKGQPLQKDFLIQETFNPKIKQQINFLRQNQKQSGQIISHENSKISHQKDELERQKLKCQKLQKQISRQREYFLSIMQKNQSIYDQLLIKSQKSQSILKQSIEIQKQQVEELVKILNKYYFATLNQISSKDDTCF